MVHRERTIDSASLSASPLAQAGVGRTTANHLDTLVAGLGGHLGSVVVGAVVDNHDAQAGSGIEMSRLTLAPMTAASLRQGMSMTMSSGASGCEDPPCRGAPRETMSMKNVYTSATAIIPRAPHQPIRSRIPRGLEESKSIGMNGVCVLIALADSSDRCAAARDARRCAQGAGIRARAAP